MHLVPDADQHTSAWSPEQRIKVVADGGRGQVDDRAALAAVPDAVADVVAHRVAHWPISLCAFKRGATQAGYEIGP